ncbi:hypothetical protein FOLKNPGA_03649 (plasmid) [Legionella sp. PC1000]|nr:hypothetical protein FOLKNPGA_03649 [Legionella sp. PC1000]
MVRPYFPGQTHSICSIIKHIKRGVFKISLHGKELPLHKYVGYFMSKIPLLMSLMLISTMAFSDAGEDWLWEKSAKPLEIETSKTVTVCTPGEGCKVIIVNGN